MAQGAIAGLSGKLAISIRVSQNPFDSIGQFVNIESFGEIPGVLMFE